MSYTPLVDTIFSGNPRVPTATLGDNDTTVANTAFVTAAIAAAVTIDTLDELTDVNTAGVVDGALLRYESTGTQWNDTTNLLLNDAGRLRVTATGATAGLEIAADLTITGDGAGEATIDGVNNLNIGPADATFIVMHGGDIQIKDTGHLSVIDPGSVILDTYDTGGNPKFSIGSAGLVEWGDGVATVDTNLYRDAANLLKTDDAFEVGGKLFQGAAVSLATTTKTAAYTVDLATDHVILCDTTGGAFTVTLPATHAAGDVVVIKDVGGTAATDQITIDPADTDTIDGLGTFVTTVNYQSVTLVSNGTNWFAI